MPHRTLLSVATILAAFLTAGPARADWIWPVRGEVITPYRNGDDPYARGQHRGIDVAASVGTQVVAAVGGVVRFAGTAGSSGLTVSLRTGDGAFDTSYLHLSALSVRGGDTVAAGDRVGAVGVTGVRSAERPHLHFGVRDAGTKHGYRDPLAFLPPAPAPNPDPLPITPEPVPRAIPRGAPAPSPAPLGAPAPRPAPRGAPVPRRVPRSAPRAAPAPRGAPAPHRAPRHAPRGAPAPHHEPRGAPTPRHAPRGAPAWRQGPQRAPRSARAPSERVPDSLADPRAALPSRPVVRDRPGAHAPGPDIGMVLACLGLLAAAAVIGLSGDGERQPRSVRGRLAALLSRG